jgi:hypothetical protein
MSGSAIREWLSHHDSDPAHATPVLGGMVSSLVHVLLVTPVIFYWLRERELRREEAERVTEARRFDPSGVRSDQ